MTKKLLTTEPIEKIETPLVTKQNRPANECKKCCDTVDGIEVSPDQINAVVGVIENVRNT
jgi:hypothetical protein